MIKKGTKVVGVWGAYIPDSFGVVTHAADLCKIEWDGECGNFKDNARTYVHWTRIKPSYRETKGVGIYVNDL
tara:strand:+ start:2813 stop:3028 length:216 start_codon:yes stop_codon:yes gene_type:complete